MFVTFKHQVNIPSTILAMLQVALEKAEELPEYFCLKWPDNSGRQNREWMCIYGRGEYGSHWQFVLRKLTPPEETEEILKEVLLEYSVTSNQLKEMLLHALGEPFYQTVKN